MLKQHIGKSMEANKKDEKFGCIINSVGECKFTTLFLFIKKT